MQTYCFTGQGFIVLPDDEASFTSFSVNIPEADHCYLCGKVLAPGAGFSIHVVEGGAKLWPISGKPYADEFSDLGFHQVGKKCARKIARGYKQRNSE